MNIETHPWQPFVPTNAKILFLGTFPPKANKWSMDFYYPNKINDFWRIIGNIFHGDYEFFFNPATNCFNKELIQQFLRSKCIALGDVGYKIIRHKDNASDKFLEIVTPINLIQIILNTPTCNTIVSTGQKAAETIAKITNTKIPKIGEYITYKTISNRTIYIYRMPSTSRAYPQKKKKKSAYYKQLLNECNIL